MTPATARACASKAWAKTKHMQVRTFLLLGWMPPQEWRADRGCVVLGLRSNEGVGSAGVVESGYGSELVELLPHLTRADYRRMRAGIVGLEPSLVGEVKCLEWSPAGGLRHATLLRVMPA